jgi:hypothetical protein
MAANATFALKPGLCVRRVRFVIVSPDPRQLRRCQAGKPVIGLPEFAEPSLGARGPKDAPAVLYALPAAPVGTRSPALEMTWDLPSPAAGATANIGVAVPDARRGHFADAALDVSSMAFVLDRQICSNNSVLLAVWKQKRVQSQDISLLVAMVTFSLR